MPDLIRTSDVAFRPIDVKLGPDGALYIADWSNPVINHGEVDFRDPRRDRTHGRIWRVSRKDTPVVQWEPLLAKATPALLDKLLSPSLWEKEQARDLVGKRLAQEIESRKSSARATGLVTLGDESEDSLSEVQAWYNRDRNDARLREAALLESAFTTTGWARFRELSASAEPGNRALVPRLMSALRSRSPQILPRSATPAPAATPNPDSISN